MKSIIEEYTTETKDEAGKVSRTTSITEKSIKESGDVVTDKKTDTVVSTNIAGET